MTDIEKPCVFCGKETKGYPISDICYTCDTRVCRQCTESSKEIKHYRFGGNHASGGNQMYCEFCEDKIPGIFKRTLGYYDRDIKEHMAKIDDLNEIIRLSRKIMQECVENKEEREKHWNV
jgi:hypothetical protein